MSSLVVALVGNPNSGKTTLFNSLTGGHQQVGNWAGVTVDLKKGQFVQAGIQATLVDLPGCYSLDPALESALDEKIAIDYVLSRKPSVIVNVVDAVHLERHLYLTLQLLEQDLPLIVVLNRMDLAKKEGISIDSKALAKRLNCPVIEMVAFSDSGRSLKEAILKQASPSSLAFHLTSKQALFKTVEARYAEIRDYLAAVLTRARSNKPSFTTYLDNVVLNKWVGLPLFFILMYAVFWVTIDLGGRAQFLFSSWLHYLCVEKSAALLYGLKAPSWAIGLLSTGLGQGIQTTLGFIPVLTCLFLCLSFLKHSGYMARAAFVMDKIMQFIGLSGKSFVPLVLGFGCNVPAVLTARTLENRRERILTILMIPFMSCGARLAIYALFVAAFFKDQGQNVVFGLYLMGIVIALLTGLVLRKPLLKDQNTPFIMELPSYQLPPMRLLLRITYQRLQHFLLNAGAIIIPLCMVIGLLGSLKTTQEDTWLTSIGKHITPIFSPMGIEQDNWPATMGLLTGILAKEVVVGTLSALYADQNGEVLGVMADRFGTAEAAVAYLIFVLLYFPCVSVLAVIARELNGSWALFSAIWTTGIAYGVAVLFYQITQFSQHPLYSGLWVSGILFSGGLGIYGVKVWLSQRIAQKPRSFPTQIVVS